MNIAHQLRSRLHVRRVEFVVWMRASSRRHSWWPPAVGSSITLLFGLWLEFRASSESLSRLGQMVFLVGGLGLVLIWVHATAGRQNQRRDLLSQVNSGISLDGCDFGGIDIVGAYLRERSMNSIRLAHARCRRVDFTGSQMHDAVLTRADLRNTQFNRVIGTELRAYRADLREARFDGADLSGAHFESADLRDADFGTATLFGADFRWSDLRGADLSRADITGVLLTGARCDDSTRWPQAMSASQLDARGAVLPYRTPTTPALAGDAANENGDHLHPVDDLPGVVEPSVGRFKSAS
ncbi:MAG: pentapeptide repeat-containing protein [Acidimicrobiales bacterium]|nr:pentapeptide repeat-containing protein [Acidimicrobiales bacterium]